MDDRGLTPSTVLHYQRFARRFLAQRGARTDGRTGADDLSRVEVSAYMLEVTASSLNSGVKLFFGRGNYFTFLAQPRALINGTGGSGKLARVVRTGGRWKRTCHYARHLASGLPVCKLRGKQLISKPGRTRRYHVPADSAASSPRYLPSATT